MQWQPALLGPDATLQTTQCQHNTTSVTERQDAYQNVLEDIAAERTLQIADVVRLFQDNRGWSVGTYVPNDIVHVNRNGNRLAAIAARDAIELVRSQPVFLTN